MLSARQHLSTTPAGPWARRPLFRDDVELQRQKASPLGFSSWVGLFALRLNALSQESINLGSLALTTVAVGNSQP